MRLLLIHADHIEYEARKKALRAAPELSEAERSARMEEALAAFVTVEREDESGLEDSVAQAAAEIRKVADQVGTARVMLYPYAHLSESLSSPAAGQRALELLEEALEGLEVKRSPFGWYKAFSLRCKGHALSELSRRVLPGGAAAASPPPAAGATTAKDAPPARAEEGETEALKAEKTLKSEWFVLTPEGDLVAAESFDFSDHEGLERLYTYEAKGSRRADREPAHIQLMQDLELVDYEPGSDTGNMRWFPKGQLIKRLLEEKVNRLCRDAGAMQIETPIMYDTQHPALNKYLQKFPARQYRVQSDQKEFFLRFAACFGMYLSMGRATLSYRHLPARIYELTHYSFRREQSGETAGIKRLRCFTMPDMHTLVADADQAKDEFLNQFRLSQKWMEDVGVPYETAVRFVRPFYDEHKEFAAGLARTVGRPVLVEMWQDQSFYFVMKFEFNVNDSVDKAFALSTVQIDTQNPQHFRITYTDRDGSERTPLLLHASLSGAIDRTLAAILETEAMRRDGGSKPALPFWLAPTHVRFIPVNDDLVDECLELAQAINDGGGRADVDDGHGGMGKKIRNAEKEWVPVIVVVGEKERESGVYRPRVRRPEYLEAAGVEADDEDVQVQWPALLQVVERNLAGQPRAPLPLPVRLSQRPVFRG